MTELWQRQPGETDKAYVGFLCYRDLEPHERTVDKAFDCYRQQAGKKPATHRASGYFVEWYQKHNWPERCAAWDNHVDGLEKHAFINQRIKNKQQRIMSLAGLHGKAVQALAKADMGEITISELVNALRVSVQELRKEFDDEPISRIEQSGEQQVVVKMVKGVSFDDI